KTLAHDHLQNPKAACAKRHSHSYLTRALLDTIGNHRIQRSSGQEQGGYGEYPNKRQAETAHCKRTPHHLFHGTNIRSRNSWVEIANLLSDYSLERPWQHPGPQHQKRGAAQPWHGFRDHLSPRKINIERRLHLQLLLFHITDYSDNLNGTRIAVRVVDQK